VTERLNSAPLASTAGCTRNPPPAQFTGTRILVAEDDLICQMVAARMLRQLGCQADVAGNGEEALAAVAAHQYDLVLMDVQMPKMDGFQAAAAIRRREEQDGGHLPILAVTANAYHGSRERCLAAGMDECVVKPFRLAELAGSLEPLLGRRQNQPLPLAPSNTIDPPKPIVFDRQAVMSRMGDDAAHVSRVLRVFIRETAAQLAQMRQDWAAAKIESVTRQAHALKGAAGMAGASSLRAVAETLEQAGRQSDSSSVESLLKALENEFARFRAELATA
jgi:two-component system, sensor histidine kinase and response regulator